MKVLDLYTLRGTFYYGELEKKLYSTTNNLIHVRLNNLIVTVDRWQYFYFQNIYFLEIIEERKIYRLKYIFFLLIDFQKIYILKMTIPRRIHDYMHPNSIQYIQMSSMHDTIKQIIIIILILCEHVKLSLFLRKIRQTPWIIYSWSR